MRVFIPPARAVRGASGCGTVVDKAVVLLTFASARPRGVYAGRPMSIEGPVSSAAMGLAASSGGHLGLRSASEGRRCLAGGGGAGGGRAWDAARLRVLVVHVRDPPADDRARETLSGTFLRDRIERALRWRDTVAAGGSVTASSTGRDGFRRSWWTEYGDYLPSRRSRRHERAKGRDRRGARGLLKPRASSSATTRGCARSRAWSRCLGPPRRGAGLGRGGGGRRALPRGPPQGQKTGPLPRPAREHLAARQYGARCRVLDGFTYDAASRSRWRATRTR